MPAFYQVNLVGLLQGFTRTFDQKTLGFQVIFDDLPGEFKSEFKKLDEAGTFRLRKGFDLCGLFQLCKRFFKIGKSLFSAYGFIHVARIIFFDLEIRLGNQFLQAVSECY